MQLELLQSFDSPSPSIPPRSKLVSLKPRERGTAYAEGLISYLTRLAGAHVVRPNVLMKDVILPIAEIHLETGSCSFNEDYSRTINSYVVYASKVSCAIEALTLQSDLRELTFLPWGDLLDPKGVMLLRDHVGVCRQCLDEFEKEEDGIYYPLVWYVRLAKICSKHQRWLEEECPRCCKKQSFVAHHAMLGYCTHCGAWLGTSVANVAAGPSAVITARDSFLVSALEQMIGHNSVAGTIATNKRFVGRLSLYIQSLTGGNIRAFEKRLGFNQDVVLSWLTRGTRPRIDRFLELCFRLGQTPIQFLTADIPADFASGVGSFELPPAIRAKPRSKEELRAIEAALKLIADGPDAQNRIDVAASLGVTPRFLVHHFPELASAISEKWRRNLAVRTARKRAEKIRRAKAVIEKMFVQLRPISRRAIWAALEHDGLTFADRDIRQAVRAVIEEHRRKNAEPMEDPDGEKA